MTIDIYTINKFKLLYLPLIKQKEVWTRGQVKQMFDETLLNLLTAEQMNKNEEKIDVN